MVKKVRKQAVVERVLPEQIKESAQQLWDAGRGAITRAHQEGNRVFEALVREGESIRATIKSKTRSVADVGDVATRATDTWDRIEQVFEKRVARALATLGVPTRAELTQLNRRLDAVDLAIGKLSGKQVAKPVATVATAPTRKAAAKGAPKAAAATRRRAAAKKTPV